MASRTSPLQPSNTPGHFKTKIHAKIRTEYSNYRRLFDCTFDFALTKRFHQHINPLGAIAKRIRIGHVVRDDHRRGTGPLMNSTNENQSKL
jgi:hypothetical protein